MVLLSASFSTVAKASPSLIAPTTLARVSCGQSYAKLEKEGVLLAPPKAHICFNNHRPHTHVRRRGRNAMPFFLVLLKKNDEPRPLNPDLIHAFRISTLPGSHTRSGLDPEAKEQSDISSKTPILSSERKGDTHDSQPASWKNSFSGSFKTTQSLEAAPLAPVLPFTGTFITAIGLIVLIGVVLERWTWRFRQRARNLNSERKLNSSIPPQVPTGLSVFLEKDFKKKESVEWVNMVLGKLFKIYRIGLERWLVGLLQPLIDNLKKPDYVERVEIKQFFLGEEPLAVRSVERRTSRRVNDLQYHIGLRYTGGARMLLLLKLKFGFVPVIIPVGVRGLDVDGEVWVKLRLVPSEPYVGSATWAFVSLPKIILDLTPFRLFNIMAIPFLSVFLTKLLTRDLPQLFVRPNKNVIDFLGGKSVGPVSKNFKIPASNSDKEGDTSFSGELSVTLIEARKLRYIFNGKTDPYVVLTLGDQIIYSKKNSQTSVIGPPGAPIWNQDFQLLVVDPKTQNLRVQVRDSFGLTSFTVGTCEVELSRLQDTVPTDKVIALRGGWYPFQNRFSGEILLRLTYKAYVEDEEEDEKEDKPLVAPFLDGVKAASIDRSDISSVVSQEEHKGPKSASTNASIIDMSTAVLTEFDSEVNNKEFLGSLDMPEAGGSAEGNRSVTVGKSLSLEGLDQTQSQTLSTKTVLLWLGLVTATVLLVALSLDVTSSLNP